MNSIKTFTLIALSVVLLTACNEVQETEKAVAVIYPTQGNSVFGKVLFSQVEDGVKVEALLYNLTPGKHGFHVHQYGDCSSVDGKAAGGHFNPHGEGHASPVDGERHMGDLGNIVANEQGVAAVRFVDTHLSMTGVDSMVGRSVIVHAGEDDLKSQPSGAAGPRAGCGVIGVAK